MKAELSNTFLWGAATSAHQVEGNNCNNDWWEWEQADPKRTSSGQAADHFNCFREDLALAKKLGHTAHRLSLEWSRLEPKQGVWDANAVAHYRDVLSELKRLDMKVFLTLNHFTIPLWFTKRGGWTWKDAPQAFESYARRAAESFGDLVDFWITINEPNVYLSHGFWIGQWPPEQKKRLFSLLNAANQLIRAHRMSYEMIHSIIPRAHVGIAPSLIGYFPARTNNMGDNLAARYSDWMWNHALVNRVASSCDFLGLQYYFSRKRQFTISPPFIQDKPWNSPATDMGWPIVPEGLMKELRHFASYNIPLYITENGLADATDSKREQFIRDHLAVVTKAIQEGIDIRGYLYWSLLDNFEWAEGFGPRFGLIEVDYNTQQRTIRPSAYAYQRIMQEVVGRLSRSSVP